MRNRILSYIFMFLIVVESIFIGRSMPKTNEYPFVDSRLRPFIEEFVKEAKSRGVPVNPETLGVMVFTALPAGIAGFCNSADPSWSLVGLKHTGVVLFDSDYEGALEDPEDYTFKALIFHELGHCLLQRGHDDKDYLTIMTSMPIGDDRLPYRDMSDAYKKNWKRELDDLFYRPNGFPPPEEFKIQ